MARRRKMDPERKAFINSLLEYYQPKDAQDIQEMLKDLLGETLQGMLEAEMDDHLGYSKYDYKNKETDDSRNGYSPKTVTSSMGTIDLDIPRHRKGEFEPQIVKKNQTDISNIEDQVLSMYAKGMTTRDISSLGKHEHKALRYIYPKCFLRKHERTSFASNKTPSAAYSFSASLIAVSMCVVSNMFSYVSMLMTTKSP